MKKTREYRATYTNIRHDPDFLPMSKDAKAYWWMLKAELHVSGIGTVMLHTIAGLASMTVDEAKDAETELAVRGWIQRDGAVVWIVNGLQHTPNLSPKDLKHRLYITEHVKGLPRCTLTDAFRARYSEWLVDSPPVGPSEGATEGPSDGGSEGRTEKKEEGRSKTNPKVKKQSPRQRAAKARATWLKDFADAWVERFGGEMSIEPALQPIGKLISENDRSEVLRRWRIYLAASDALYANPARFKQTYGEWEKPPPTKSNGFHARPGIANRVFAKGEHALRDEP